MYNFFRENTLTFKRTDLGGMVTKNFLIIVRHKATVLVYC